MKTLAARIPGPLLLMLLVVVYSACDDGSSTAVEIPKALPFDNFWLSTQFDNIPSTTGDFFHTWIDVSNYPAGETQVYYNYWEKSELWAGPGIIPLNYRQVSYSLSKLQWTIAVKGELRRRGFLVPGTTTPSEWPHRLEFEVDAVVDPLTMTVTSAVVRFPQFYQVIDFAANSQVEKISVDGREAIQLTCDGPLKAGDLSSLTVFMQFTDILP